MKVLDKGRNKVLSAGEAKWDDGGIECFCEVRNTRADSSPKMGKRSDALLPGQSLELANGASAVLRNG